MATLHQEMTRILSLPRIPELTAGEVEAMQRVLVLGSALNRGFRLFPIQVKAIAAYARCNGLFAPIGVGHGKTLTGLSIAEWAFQKKGIDKILLIMPSSVVEQFTTKDIPFARAHIPISYPIHVIAGQKAAERLQLSKAREGLFVYSYSLLSRSDGPEILNNIRPGLVIADEAHKLANKKTAAQTKRLLAAIKENQSQFVAMSGTITTKGLRDYHHIISQALGESSPLPKYAMNASSWAEILDSVEYFPKHEAKQLDPLRQWAGVVNRDQAGYRKAFSIRLRSSPGVVATKEGSIGTSLIIANQSVSTKCPGFDELETMRRDLAEHWVTPNGDELSHAILTHKWHSELSAGFYNELFWPKAEVIAKRLNVTLKEAEEDLELSQIYFDAAKDYDSVLRKFLKHAPTGLDTPFLVGRSLVNHGAYEVPYEIWQKWQNKRDLDFEGRIERQSRAVRVCDYKVQAAVKWAKKAKHGILWCYHRAMVDWVFEALEEAGLNPIKAPAGKQGNKAITNPKHGRRLVVASIKGHGTGKNLQHFNQQYFVQWPRAANTAEQTLGRLHRVGQKADEITANTNLTTEWDYANYAATLCDAVYIQQTTQAKQKVVYASYSPPPKVYEPAILREMGLEPSMVTSGQLKKALRKTEN